MFDINSISRASSAQKIPISEKILELSRVFRIPPDNRETEGVSRINVHEVISKLAFIYEKIRNTIDYRDEHLFRIYAILRILKRRIFFEEKKKNHGEILLKELIRGGYLDNDTVPETSISEVDFLVEKYLSLMNFLPDLLSKKEKRQIVSWLMILLAGEIEENLTPNQNKKTHALVNLMYSVMKERIVLMDEDLKLSEKEKDIQILIACHRVLMKADSNILNYELFKYYYPEWPGATPSSLINEVAQNIVKIKTNIDLQINHLAGDKFYLALQKHTAPYLILGDIFSEYPDQTENILSSPESFEKSIKIAAGKRYARIQSMLKRSGRRSIIYIFITKVFLAFLLEIPYDLYITHGFYWPALVISIGFPPILMFAMVSSVKIQREKNTSEIIRELKQLVYTAEAKIQHGKIKIYSQRSVFLRIVFGILNLGLFIISFGLIIGILTKLNFSIFSQAIFLIFLALISFFAVQIRKSADQILVVERRENILGMVAGLLGFPLIQVGRWISSKFRSINIAAFIFDIFIETPLKSFIVISEQWTSYIKERREGVGKP